MASAYAPIAEYLTSVLSQRGPSAVPYDEAVKWNVRDHVSELQKVFPTLTAKLSEYHSNDGRALNVLKVEGTIPIHFQGAKYNIPILMWLAERYPYSPPQVFVVPTANMIVRAGTFVNPSGEVATPLLRGWLYPSSNLVDAVLEMSQVFGAEPPLYTRPPGYTPPPPEAQPHSQPPAVVQPPAGYPLRASQTMAHGPGAGPPAASTGPVAASFTAGYYPTVSGAASSSLTPYATPSPGNTPNSTPGPGPGPGPSWPGPYGAVPPPPPPPPPPPFGLGGLFNGIGGFFNGIGGGGQQQPPPPPPPPPEAQPPPPPHLAPQQQQLLPPVAEQQQQQQQAAAVSREELDVHFRHLAVAALSSQLRALHRGFGDYCAAETVKCLEAQAQLGERRAALHAAHEALTRERMGTEQLVGELAAKTKALESWLEVNEPKAASYDPDTRPVASCLHPADELSRQGMETQAQDLAAEDAILALDKLLQTGQVPVDAYLKQVRALCRKQFFSRALGLKVAAAQQQQASTQPQQQAPVAASRPYPMAHGDGWSHAAPPPPPGGHPQQQQQQLAPPPAPPPPPLAALHTGVLTNPLAGPGR